jgi:NAD(P)-dependent dehydrogenase (short-subunit alcohol dehydrogenase family)
VALTRTIVVVGAGPGLGAAIARRFAREGFRVALVARTAEGIDLTGMDLAGPPAVAAADVADEAGLRAGFAELRSQVGDPEVCVYNPSLFVPGTPSELSYDGLLQGLRVGLLGAVVAVQEVVPAMRAAGRGTILLTGSGVGLKPPPSSAALGMQKAALRNLAQALAEELRADGIHAATVTIRGALAPGTPFDPDVVADAFWQLHAEGARDPQTWHAELEVTPSGFREPSPLRPSE